MDSVFKDLFNTIQQRKHSSGEGSYTGYLFEKGLDKILKKCGEECAEMIIAAKNGDRVEIVLESCDLIYHMLVMLSECDVPLESVTKELQARSNKQGNLKKARITDKNS